MNENKETTIEQLEVMLESDKDYSIEILPDGSILAVEEGDKVPIGPRRIWTLNEAMSDGY